MNFPIPNISSPPVEPKKEHQDGTMYPIYFVSAPEVVARGISQPANVINQQQQQQLPQISDFWLNENLSTIFQPPAQDQQFLQQPIHLTAEAVDIQDSDIVNLLDDPTFSQRYLPIGQDYVYADAVEVQSASETENITKKLEKMSIKTEKNDNTDKLQSSTNQASSLEQLSGMDMVRRLFLDVASDLHSYAATGTVSSLLKRTVYLLAMQSEDGDNALHCALWNNQLDVFYSMLNAAKSHKASHDLINSKNDLNATPLHMAVAMKNPKAVAALMEAGADPLIVDKEGNTSIHIAAKDRQLTPCLEHILQIYDQKATKNTFKLDMLNYEGMAPLHLAVNADLLEAVKLLIQSGASVNVIEAKMGRTPLHMAVEKKQKEIIKVLLSSPNVNVNLQSYDGSTPLHVAVAEELEDICQLLCQKGANPSTKSFVNIFAGGIVEEVEEESDSEDNEEQVDIDVEEEETRKPSGISPLELAKGKPMILNVLKQDKPSAKVSVDFVESDCSGVSSAAETSSRALDSGIDIMASRDLSVELDDNIIDKLKEALESSAPDCWKTLAKSLNIPAALMGTVENHKSPITYILQNLEVLEANPHTILDTLAEMKLTEAFNILDGYLNH